MQIIVDTREQLPLFDGLRQTLVVGDYTTPKLKGRFHIERKSLQDLYGTLTTGNRRFKYELFRAAYHQIEMPVLVEGTYQAFINKQFPRGKDRKPSPEVLEKLISTFERKYYVKFIWCKNRSEATKKAILLLRNKK